MNGTTNTVSHQTDSSREVVLLGAVMAIAWLLRLAVLAMLPDLTADDALNYREAGIDLFERGSMASDVVMPLYPAWTFLSGGGLGLKLADITLSVLTVGVLYCLTFEMFHSRAAALLAAVMAAAYPFFLYYSILGITETAYTFLVCSGFLALYRSRFALGSVLLVLSVLTRPTLDLLAPILVLTFSLFIHHAGWSVLLRRVATYAFVYAILLAPWWVYNFGKYRQFVRLNLGDGPALYEGNLCPQGFPALVEASAELRDCGDFDFSGVADPVKQNGALKVATVRLVWAHPLHFVKLAALKFVAYWRPWVYTPDWRFKAASWLSYGVVLTLAGAFLLLRWQFHVSRLAPVLLFGAYLCAVHVVTASNIRYRLPFEPFLIAIASYAAVFWLTRWRHWIASRFPPVTGGS